MEAIFKISTLNEITQVKEELIALGLCYEADFSSIELSMGVKNLTLSASGAPSFDIEDDLIRLTLLPSEEKILLRASQLEQSEYLLTLVDELMMDEFTKQSQHLFNSKKSEQGWQEALSEMDDIITKAPSMDSLYHRVRNSNEWGSKKNYFLYKILMSEQKVLDLDLVYDFIDNFFEIRFADLALHYTLKPEYEQAIMSDPGVNPVVKAEYEEKHLEAEDVNEIIATQSEEIIRNYFFNKLMKLKNSQNFSTEYMALLKCPHTPADVLEGISKEIEIIFIYAPLLSHPNCPESLIKKYALTAPAYGLSILKNPHTPGHIIHEMVTHDLAFEPAEEFKALVLTHPNAEKIDKEMIVAKEEKIAQYDKNLSTENLDKMLTDTEVKFNLNEVWDYALKLKRAGLVGFDSLEAIEEEIKTVEGKMNKLFDTAQIVKELTHASFNLEKTGIFLNSPVASEEVCAAIIKEELGNTTSFIHNPLIDEISKKHPNLLVMDCRPEVIERIKEVASGKDAKEVAVQVVDNLYFLSPKFNLTAEERAEIKEKLLNNPHLDLQTKTKVKEVS